MKVMMFINALAACIGGVRRSIELLIAGLRAHLGKVCDNAALAAAASY